MALRAVSLALLLGLAVPAQATCWSQAEARYGVPAWLLETIAKQESGMNPRAVGRNKNGTEDIGLMQINSSWNDELAAFGIKREHLFDPCTNVQVGAWIMAHNIRQFGWSWRAIGAYNARSERKRVEYAWKIYNRLAAHR